MLPPSYLDAMPDAFVQLAQQVEDEILQDVARRIGKMGTLTETADWQLWRYQQTEAVRENVVKLLAKYSGKSEATIRRLLKEAATEAMEREDAIYYHYNLEPTPFEESAALNNLLNAGRPAAHGGTSRPQRPTPSPGPLSARWMSPGARWPQVPLTTKPPSSRLWTALQTRCRRSLTPAATQIRWKLRPAGRC